MRPVAFFERATAVLGLALSTSAILPLLHSTDPSATATDPTSQRLWLAVYLGTAIAVVRRWDSVLMAAKENLAVVLVVALAGASIWWSADARYSTYEVARLILATAFAAFLATTFDLESLTRMLAWTLAALIGMSLLTALFLPKYGLDHFRFDSWRGVFGTKNELGRIAALSTLVWVVVAVARYRPRLLCLMIAAGSAVVGWQAGSRSALVVLGVAAMYFVVLPALRAEPNLAVSSVSFLLAAGVIGVAWAFDGFVSALSGSDTSLTGRPAIWNGVWRAIDQHEWLGYGYSAFWRGFDGPSAVIWDVLPSHPPHAHNAMLDIWLELGLIGVGAVGAAVAILLVRALRLVRGPGRPKANILPLTLIVFFLAFSVTESTLVPGASLFWILFATASFSTSRATSARFARERLVSDPVPLAVRS